jgi:membrane-bound lytic murein transglycosylase D
MKLLSIVFLACAVPLTCMAQQKQPTFDDLINAGRQWTRENVDPDVLNALENMKLPEAREFCDDILRQFQSNDVVDMDKFKQTAAVVVPLLEEHKDTQAYGAWLRTRLDYFEVAGKLRATSPPAYILRSGQPPEKIANPSAEKEREAWRKELQNRAPLDGAEAFAARLKPIFLAQQVPAPLVWMAEVESSFAPDARSPSGAVGLFQIMPDTARSLHLSLWPFDQRLDPEKNAACAARYLKCLHDRFNDWPLVLAAYNSGETRVQALLEKHNTKTYDGIATHLPAETQFYVPKINATLLRREGIGLADLGVVQ